MTGIFKKFLKSFWRSDRGAVAALVAVLLPASLGLVGAAVDLGVLYTARQQLKNAADASALAAASTMVTADSQGNAVVDTAGAYSEAVKYAGLNKSIEKNLMLLANDYVAGKWDAVSRAFSSTGGSNPDDLTAVQVTLRRDELANSPVSTWFAKILGIDQVSMRATSVAYVGSAGVIPRDGVDLPIAVSQDAVAPGGNGPNCGGALEFHSEPDETAQWTTFFKWPANTNTVDDYICHCLTPPELAVGDVINITNGNLANSVFNHLQQEFYRHRQNGEWPVVLPVVANGPSNNQREVTGFMTFVITEVNAAPDKNVRGYLKCGMVASGSKVGGKDFGTRAELPVLLR